MSAPARGCFVTGTDTGVGKTLVACSLVTELRARGADVGVLKAVETGVGAEGPLDAIALRAAAGADDPPGDVCPQQFALPAAPNVAAAAEGAAVDLGAVRAAHARIAARHELVLVEGAGGLLVPIAAGFDMADLARELALPVLVVARAALGTINHTRLTLEAVAARGLPLLGVVVSHAEGPLSDADAANLGDLRSRLGPRLLAEVPPLAAGAAPPTGCLDAVADRLWPRQAA